MGAANFHAGKTGDWSIIISRSRASEGGYSGTADISFNGRHRCKLLLSGPDLSEQIGDELLKQKCIDWIERQEAEIDVVSRSAEREET
ncbi:hypothetical protein EJO68_34220 [Variovorax atrisoli]|uniref:hypothetical protein n=1 Tax=Variovorax atrisoli TaxID=3394203 RepID=UPI000F7E5751|nr:hypothetical protein [Variovorax sp. 369]RTD83256.1 hypothetical protein EJO68_34220 [Variovorax sp. 369]